MKTDNPNRFDFLSNPLERGKSTPLISNINFSHETNPIKPIKSKIGSFFSILENGWLRTGMKKIHKNVEGQRGR